MTTKRGGGEGKEEGTEGLGGEGERERVRRRSRPPPLPPTAGFLNI